MLATEMIKDEFLPRIKVSNRELHNVINNYIKEGKIFYLSDYDQMIESALAMTKDAETLKFIAKPPFDIMILDFKTTVNDEPAKTAHMLYREGEKIHFLDQTIITKKNGECIGLQPVTGYFEPDSLKIEADKGYQLICGILGTDEETENLKFHASSLCIRAMMIFAMLNSPKIIDKTDQKYERINRKRTARGQEPLIEYSLIKLQKHIAENLLNTDPDNPQRKLHWRRGHFKMRKTGIFWWNAHTAGHKELGEIKSGYVA